MATEPTAPSVAEIDVRWEMANYGRPTRYGSGRITDQIGAGPTKQHVRVGRGLEEIAASLVPDGVWEEEMQDDPDGLANLTGELWEEIERRFKAWAARAPERRARIRAQWAAEKAAKEGTAA